MTHILYNNDRRPQRSDLLIVDGICNGGRTFAGTAQMLKAKGAQTLVLIVSHGIFSKCIEIPGVDAIYTTDSYRKVERIPCLLVEKYLSV